MHTLRFAGIVVAGGLLIGPAAAGSALAAPAFTPSVAGVAPRSDITDPPSGTRLDTATPTITGTAPAGHLIQVVAEDLINRVQPGGCTVTVPASGLWSCVVGPALPAGRYRITAADVSAPGTPVAEVTSITINPRQLASTPAGPAMPYALTGLVLLLAGAALLVDAMRPVRAPVVATPSRHRALRRGALDVARHGADAPTLQALRRIYRPRPPTGKNPS